MNNKNYFNELEIMKKIMFNDDYGLTQATIEGRKTMTRRAEFTDSDSRILDKADDVYVDGDHVIAHFDSDVEYDAYFPTRYKVGEVVAVAQRYEDIPSLVALSQYRTPGFRNKMFVKAELMPHRIRITGIRAERLQDISDEDCIKEGVRVVVPDFAIQPTLYEGACLLWPTPRAAFAHLINKVSGRGTWASNQWVVAYEYELVK